MKVRELKVLGDSKIIFREVKNSIHFNSPHLKAYHKEVQYLINYFEAFNISSIPRNENREVDSLATTTYRLSPLEGFEMRIFSIQIMYKPSIPYNITNWRVFENDKHIINFVTNKNVFSDVIIDENEHEKSIFEETHNSGKSCSSNTIARNVVTLKKKLIYKISSRNRPIPSRIVPL